jgi:hypothetical protein
MTRIGKPGQLLLTAAGLVCHGLAFSQLPAPGESGITTGHVHLNVPDTARHTDAWASLGGTVKSSGRLQVIEFPGIYVILTESEPEAPSVDTSANHFGFSVRDYADYRDRLESIGASFFFEDEANGQILADLPDGVRIEILTDPEQAEPIRFHHIHLSTSDAESLRGWYLDVFEAGPGERRGLPSALVPGGRVDFIPARGDAPRGSRGIEFDFGPMAIDAIELEIAFITDPAGTYIEITEGLAAVE